MSNYLQNEFTAWLTTILRRARVDYLRKLYAEADTQPLDENMVSESDFCIDKTDFDFENEDLYSAFNVLTMREKEIIRLSFVERLTPEEIAQKLNKSGSYVYNMRYKTLRKLKAALKETKND